MGQGKKRKGRKALLITILLLAVLLALLLYTLEQLTPLIQTAAMRQSLLLISGEITRAARDRLLQQGNSLTYTELMHIERDDEGMIRLLAPDSMLLNQVIADTSLAVHQCMQELEEHHLYLPLGIVTGNWLLSTLGPNLRFGFMFQGVPRIELRDELDDAGINQVRHRIWLDIGFELQVIVPFSTATDTVSCTVLLAEGIIVGYTPETYLGIGESSGE